MRQLLDILVAVMLAGLITGGVLMHRSAERRKEDIAQVKASVASFQGQLHLMRAIIGGDEIPRSIAGYPLEIDPEWFEHGLPGHPLLNDGRPWLEIAGPDQCHLWHPEQRVADDRSLAAFWYNPCQGIVRARVPRTRFESRDAALYAYVNGLSPDLPEPH